MVRESHGRDDVTLHNADPLPEGRATIAEEFVHHLDTNDPPHPCLEIPLNLDAMAALSAGLRAADSGTQQIVNNQHWRIG